MPVVEISMVDLLFQPYHQKPRHRAAIQQGAKKEQK